MKTGEVTLRILLQFTSFPRFSLAPANSDEITTLAVNRMLLKANSPHVEISHCCHAAEAPLF
jgi:hypothetical protein